MNSCNNDDLTNETSQNEPQNAIYTKTNEGVIPFTVENVQNALTEVLRYYENERPSVAKHFSNYKVNTTHVYYRFIPQDSLQYAKLMEEDEALQLTTDPFEFTVKERVEDPGENEIPIFYAIVAVDTKIPDVPTEKIAELHFTDEDNLEDTPANYDEIEFKQNLMYEARKLARDLDDEEIKEGYMNYREGFEKNTSEKTTLGLFGKKWRPSGIIRVEEDIVNQVTSTRRHFEGVKNARVNVLKWGWLRIEHGTTDANGYFSTGTTYTKKVHYKVKFKNNYVTVKNNNFFDTANYFSGRHKRQSLNVTFLRDGEFSRYHFFALIHNAAYDYYSRCLNVYGLRNPTNLNITARYNGNGSEAGPQWLPFNSAIRISRKSNGTYRGSDGIYATTVHELTHCGHRKMDPGMFSFFESNNKTRLLMTESWAEGVETILTNDRYRKLFSDNGYGVYIATFATQGYNTLTRGWNGKRQHTLVAKMDEYTPLVIDLVDNLNQNTLAGTTNLPVDRVSGYTLGQIQSALNTSRTLNDWKTRLLNSTNNPTKNFIDDVFDYAQFVRDNNL